MGGCSQIPASAWQQLEGAQWLKLTKVDFDKRLGFLGACWSVCGLVGAWKRWQAPSRFTGAV